MAKYDFNVPLLNEANEPVKRVVYDRTKQRPDANGNLTSPVLLDDEGNAITENALISEVLVLALNHVYEGDDKLPAEERQVRGKLVRKLADKTKGSRKNYTPEELVMIKTYAAKGGATPLLLDQLQGIFDGSEGQEQVAA